MLLARRVVWCSSIIAALTVSSVAMAETSWSAYAGQLTWHLDARHVQELGLQVSAGDVTIPGSNAGRLQFEIAESSDLTVVSDALSFDFVAGGALNMARKLTVTTDKDSFRVSQLGLAVIHNADKSSTLVLSGVVENGERIELLTFEGFRPGLTTDPPVLHIESADAQITEDFAKAIGHNELAAKTLGSIECYADVTWTGGDEPQVNAGAPRGGNNGTVCDKPVGPDVIVGVLQTGFANPPSDNIGGTWYDSFSVGTTSCNVGDQDLTWQPSSGVVHPVISQNFFRLKDGRFEQIGQSWLKHGFLALSQDACGCGCPVAGDGSALKVGCSDPYGPTLNNGQSSLKPKWKVNPTLGTHTHETSLPSYTGTNTGRRLQIHVDDLDPALNAGAVYFVEGQYVHQEDAANENDNNNASYMKVTVNQTSAHEYSMSSASPTHREELAIRAWQVEDPTVTETDVDFQNDGLYVIAAKATDLGNGMWHYEYAVHNMNGNRGISSFSVPLFDSAVVENIGFHDVDYHDGDGEANVTRDGTDWPGVHADGAVTWTMVDVGEDSNALLWGTLYNFRFDANVEPDDTLGDVNLTSFRAMAGNPDGFAAQTVVPKPAPVVLQIAGGAPAPDILDNCQGNDVMLRIEDGAQTLDAASPQVWYRYGGGAFTSAALTPMGGSNYQATLPPPSCGDLAEFYFTAASTLGTTVSLPADAVATDNYFVADTGFLEINSYLDANFESGLPAGWVANGLWNVSNTCSSLPLSACGDSDGSSVAYFGKTDTCNYVTGVHHDDSLFTPPIALPMGREITLTYCSALERDTTPSGDWPEVRVTPDGQATDVIDQPAVGAFIGGPPIWNERTVDLTAYAGQTITLEFNFDNVIPTNDDQLGWMIDNVSVKALEVDCMPGCAAPDGDMNVDGSANGVDIQRFATALMGASTDAQDLAHGDFSNDGVIDMADVTDMVNTMLGN